MDEHEQAAIERECERLIVAYTHHIDFGEAGKVADLFTQDGVWESEQARMDGRDRIRQGFGNRQSRGDRMSRHVCTNVGITIQDADNATGLTYFTLYRRDGITSKPAGMDGPSIVGEYHDTFVRTDEGWRIRHRRADAAFVRQR